MLGPPVDVYGLVAQPHVVVTPYMYVVCLFNVV